MNWIKTFFLLLFSGNLLFGQNMLPQQLDTNRFKGTLIFSGLAGYGTTSIQNNFSKILFQGGEITHELTQEQLAKHKGINRFGVELGGVADYHNYQVNFLKKEKLGLVVRGGYNTYLSGNYTQDAFGLIFNGNTAYKGDTLILNGSEMNGISMQKFGIGFVNKTTKASFVLNGYNISSYQDLFVRTGEFYTDTSGHNMYISLAGKWETTTGNRFDKGWGVGVDLDYRLPVGWFNDDTAYIQLMANNIGFMQVNKATVYRVDRAINYEGYSIASWMNFTSEASSASESLKDSIGLDVREEKVYGILPGFFQVGKLINDNDTRRWQSYFGLRKYLMRAYNPLIYIGFQYRTNNWLKFGFQGSYGGFSLFKAGAYIQGDWNKIHFGLGSEDVVGLLSGKGRGQNVYLRCVYRW